MLEYALQRGSNILQHVDSVENGLKCNCVCPGCGDSLVAKNNGISDTRHHFSHYLKDESSNCSMTQLHIVSQDFFLKSQPLFLPPVSFQYKGKTLSQSELLVNVHKGNLEARVDSYIADVLLDTDIGSIVIEVFVTHENEAEKTAYYQHNKISSIEFDLSSYINRDIEDALSDLKANKVPYKWLYEWCRDKLVDEHENFLEQEKKRIEKQRIRSAKDTARKFIKGNYILLPNFTQEFECLIDGYTYRDEFTIYSLSKQSVDSVIQVKMTEELVILRAVLGNSHIWVVLLLKDFLPKEIEGLDGSVIIRTPAISENNHAIWKWLKYPKLERRIERARQNFLKESKAKANKVRKTNEAVKKATANSKLYLFSKDNFFKRDYFRWSQWMVQNRLFKSNLVRKNPKLPQVLTYIRSYPCLWPFDSWDILTLSLLAEIVDKNPKYIKIFYNTLFNELIEHTGLHKDFINIEKCITPQFVVTDKKSLVLRSEIIEAALRPYEIAGVIRLLDSGCKRLGSLMEAIDLNQMKSV